VADQDLFSFAGLWDRSFEDDSTAIESVVHITMTAKEPMAHVHSTGNNPHRMPASMRAEDGDAWLSGASARARAASSDTRAPRDDHTARLGAGEP
jgi:putative SOS response-associated peptidase YedK